MNPTTIALIITSLLTGCTPFVEFGVGHGIESGSYAEDETGFIGRYAIGVEFQERWYYPTECGYYHRSQINKSPEISVDDFSCIKRVYLKRKK